jgi:probable phosphoglycerate mutase
MQTLSKNIYFGMRHGESAPNVRGVILSYPGEGVKEENTLTAKGEGQARVSAQDAKERGSLDEHTVIYSSPFSRCKRTAEIAKEVLGVPEAIIFDDRLRERWFGDWDGTSNSNYPMIWAKDAMDSNNKAANVESAAEVVARVTDLIHDLEDSYSGRKILLVSHGDALQILQTFFAGAASSAHRELPHFAVAEIRKFN